MKFRGILLIIILLITATLSTYQQEVLYFAHPINTYGTAIEKEMIALIQKNFPEFGIENPNQPKHQAGYDKWKKKYENTPSQGMSYFYKKVLPKCGAGVVALPYLNGKIGAGVAGELIFAAKKERGTWIIEPPDLKNIRPLTKQEIKLLLEWDKLINEARNKEAREKIGNELVLSISLTREYTWLVLYKIIKPYQKAHLF